MKPSTRRTTKAMLGALSVRPVSTGTGVTYNAPVHATRTQSKTYLRTRHTLRAIMSQVSNWFFVEPPYDDHHGGGLWVVDDEGWLFVRNLVGIEWSAQFCADPKKVDALRRNARRVYTAFLRSFAAFSALRIDLRDLLDTPITSARLVARWTDSICNASVPLPPALHTGSLPRGAGVHTYPTPVTDIDRIRYDDFQLWVRDAQGRVAAVVPAGPRGSGEGAVHVVHAEPGSALHRAHLEAQAKGTLLRLPASDPAARSAFAKQRARMPMRRVPR
jgi:hypothetical protein